jgi:renalase
MIMIRQTPEIAVIGAGPAGLACADRLAACGLQVQVFDKGLQPGGRVARRHHAGMTFEHGAPGLRPVVDNLTARVPVLSHSRVTELRRDGDRWRLELDGVPLRARFASVVLAMPAAQATELVPELAPILRPVVMRPILTALVGLPGRLAHGWDSLNLRGGTLAEARRQPSERPGGPEAWVLHAAAEFSRDNLECDSAAVAQHLWQKFRAALELDLIAPIYLRGHRWRHARTVRPLGQQCWYDDTRGLGVCGDWCLGDDVQAALESGRALAGRMLGLTERLQPRVLHAGEGQA